MNKISNEWTVSVRKQISQLGYWSRRDRFLVGEHLKRNIINISILPKTYNVLHCIHMNQTTTKSPIAKRSVISINTSLDTRKRLDKLALTTKRSKSFLVNEALAYYLKEEEDFIASVKRGLKDARAGRLYTHEEAVARIMKSIGE